MTLLGVNIPAQGAEDAPGENKITQDMISILDKLWHTGINAFSGPRILLRYEKSMENLAPCPIRASFTQERMTYHRETGQEEYQSKGEKETGVFPCAYKGWLKSVIA